MTSALIAVLFVVTASAELALSVVRLTLHMRKTASMVTLLLVAATHAMLCVVAPLTVSIPLAFVGMYRLLNIMRLGYGRMNQQYLRQSCARTSIYLLASQTVLWLVVALLHRFDTMWVIGYSAMTGGSLVALVGLLAVRYNSLRSRIYEPFALLPPSELPSLTVAIPARNETNSLAECLHAFTHSDYEKLEIIVLDDCSQDKTSDIIRQFAHDGVRFVQGSEPGDTWLAKNAAYNKLAHEANGEWILFCGVDVRVNTNTLHRLVSYANAHSLDMISVLPKRSDDADVISITQLIRYLWELALPRWLIGRPPILSTVWLIRSRALQELGGLGAVRRKVVPEAHFARELSHRNAYVFLRANDTIDVVSVKSAAEQRQTALRVRYPQLHRRPELVLATAATELILMVAPWYGVYYLLNGGILYMAICAMVCTVGEIMTVSIVVRSITRRRTLVYLLQTILSLPLDIWLTHLSCYKYEFGMVEWKDRNVCLPVMHVVPRLPYID